MALKRNFMGKNIIVNLFTKHGYRVSPGANSRAKKIAACARGMSLEQRKRCFQTGGTSTGSNLPMVIRN